MEWSSGVFQTLERGGHDGGEARRRRQAFELGRAHPARFGEFVVEARLAGDPARGEWQDDEMALDTVVAVARDSLAEARERHRLDRDAGLLHHLALDRLVQRFTGLDYAAGQAEQP